MPEKIYRKGYWVFRTVEDLKRLNRYLGERLGTIPSEKKNEPLNSLEIGEWFYDEARAYLYDVDSMNEDAQFDRIYTPGSTLSENFLSEFQEERMKSIPVDAKFENGGLIISVYTTLKTREYVSTKLSYNIANEVEAKLNLLKEKEGSLYDRIPNQYELIVRRYVEKGASSRRVCDPSNIEVSHIINAVCRKMGIVDACDAMRKYTVETVDVEKRTEEKTEFVFRGLGENCVML